ncbi:polysaccharide deacetylase family protein [Phytohabitans kaempferiae]|uniref:Polysaccharide deacetylase family protein n=1 Tax=Phytohabitans kaempferiae TaxID=1620943 RepID=A0ABV6MCB2_9ACTN
MPSNRVINICFHGVGKPRRELEPGEAPYWVEEDQFLAILDEIATWPSVRISFDDGNASDVDIALPALVERGLTADFFVLAGRLDSAGSLGEDDVRELRRRGMTVGSHGMWHRPWRGMDPGTSNDELVEARTRLAGVIGEPIETAACPLGRYDRRLLTEMRRLGYKRVFTSDRRAARRDAWLQPRFSVCAPDTPRSIRAQALVPPSLVRRSKLSAVGVVKRLR